MQSEPTRSVVHLYAAQCERQLGRLDAAEDNLRKRLKVRPSDPNAHYELALVFADRGDRGRALEHLRTALRAWESADRGFARAQLARDELEELERVGGLEPAPGP